MFLDLLSIINGIHISHVTSVTKAYLYINKNALMFSNTFFLRAQTLPLFRWIQITFNS